MEEGQKRKRGSSRKRGQPLYSHWLLLTSSGLRQLRQPEQRIIARHRLKRDIRVPLVLPGLRSGGAMAKGAEPVGVQLLRLARRDDADLVIGAAILSRGVVDRVDVQARGGGLAGQFAQALDEHLLQLIGEVGLGAEEDDAPAGDFGVDSLLSLGGSGIGGCRVSTYW